MIKMENVGFSKVEICIFFYRKIPSALPIFTEIWYFIPIGER